MSWINVVQIMVVSALLVGPQVCAAESAPSKGEARSSLAKALGDDKQGDQGPVLITSKTLSLDSKKRVFIYKDTVEITRADLKINADTVTGTYDEANQMKRIQCEGNVVITRGALLKATSNRADYDVPRGVIVLTEGPELNDKGNVLNADKVTVYVDEDRSEAEGNVRVKVIKSSGGSALEGLSKNNSKPKT